MRSIGAAVGLGRKFRLAALVALTLAAAAFLAITFLDRGADRLRGIRAAGVVRIGYAVEAPYAMLGSAGEVTGEAPEIARHVVERLGIARIEWRQVRFEDLIGELRSGTIDVAAAGMFITPRREKRILFSIPTMEVRPAMLARAGNPIGAGTYHGLARAGDVRAAAIGGSVEERRLLESGIEERRMVRVPDALTGVKAVETGLADVFLLSEPSLRWIVADRKLADLEVLPVKAGPGDEAQTGRPAFAFGPNDSGLRDEWNEVLRTFLGSEEHCALAARFGLECARNRSAGGGL